MGRLKVLSGAAACSILRGNGYVEIRRKGSHIVLQAEIAGAVRTVVVPDHRELAPGTLASIIRQSGLPRSEFETD